MDETGASAEVTDVDSRAYWQGRARAAEERVATLEEWQRYVRNAVFAASDHPELG